MAKKIKKFSRNSMVILGDTIDSIRNQPPEIGVAVIIELFDFITQDDCFVEDETEKTGYRFCGVDPDFSKYPEPNRSIIKALFEGNRKKYLAMATEYYAKCVVKQELGKKGGLAKARNYKGPETDSYQMLPNATKCYQMLSLAYMLMLMNMIMRI